MSIRQSKILSSSLLPLENIFSPKLRFYGGAAGVNDANPAARQLSPGPAVPGSGTRPLPTPPRSPAEVQGRARRGRDQHHRPPGAGGERGAHDGPAQARGPVLGQGRQPVHAQRGPVVVGAAGGGKPAAVPVGQPGSAIRACSAPAAAAARPAGTAAARASGSRPRSPVPPGPAPPGRPQAHGRAAPGGAAPPARSISGIRSTVTPPLPDAHVGPQVSKGVLDHDPAGWAHRPHQRTGLPGPGRARPPEDDPAGPLCRDLDGRHARRRARHRPQPGRQARPHRRGVARVKFRAIHGTQSAKRARPFTGGPPRAAC